MDLLTLFVGHARGTNVTPLRKHRCLNSPKSTASTAEAHGVTFNRIPATVAALATVVLLAGVAPVQALFPDGLPGVSTAAWGAWKTEIVDPTWIRDLEPTSLAIDAAGRPHIVYTAGASVTDGTGSAWYAWHDGVVWNRLFLQRQGLGQGVAVEADGTVHVLFDALTPQNKVELRHGIITPTGVDVEVLTVRNVIRAAEIAVDALGILHVYYSYDGHPFQVVYGRNAGEGWTFETVDTSTWAFDDSSGMAVNSDGRVHIVFPDYGNDGPAGGEKVGYAVRDVGGGWSVQRVEPGCFDFMDVALDGTGLPHVSCRSLDDGLVYLHFDGSAWVREVLFDGLTFRDPDDRGFETAIAVDSHGQPHIAYRDQLPLSTVQEAVAPAHMKYATKSANMWVYETVDRTATATGFSSDIVVDAQDRPRLSYVMAWTADALAFGGPYPQSWNLMYAEPASTTLGLVDE